MKTASLDRFTVCLEKGLLARLDEISAERGYPSRSQALSDFIRRAIVRKDWRGGRACAGTISVAYPAAEVRPGPAIGRLLAANPKSLLSMQTHLLPGGSVLCTLSVTGRPADLERLADALRAVKGVTHGSFSIVLPL